jgi:hypothetical protein
VYRQGLISRSVLPLKLPACVSELTRDSQAFFLFIRFITYVRGPTEFIEDQFTVMAYPSPLLALGIGRPRLPGTGQNFLFFRFKLFVGENPFLS